MGKNSLLRLEKGTKKIQGRTYYIISLALRMQGHPPSIR
jgi:hypothetical protein